VHDRVHTPGSDPGPARLDLLAQEPTGRGQHEGSHIPPDVKGDGLERPPIELRFAHGYEGGTAWYPSFGTPR